VRKTKSRGTQDWSTLPQQESASRPGVCSTKERHCRHKEKEKRGTSRKKLNQKEGGKIGRVKEEPEE